MNTNFSSIVTTEPIDADNASATLVTTTYRCDTCGHVETTRAVAVSGVRLPITWPTEAFVRMVRHGCAQTSGEE